MAIRIKSKWHASQRNLAAPKGLEDHAGALAFIGWRLALESAKNINREGFEFLSDHERVGVISELVAFEVQLADRLTHERMDDSERAAFINNLGLRLADHMQDSLTDIAGPGDYRRPFIALLNDRLEDYAKCSFRDGEPGFDALRYLGDRVLKVMGESQTNRWVLDHVMAIEAPEITEKLTKSVGDLLG